MVHVWKDYSSWYSGFRLSGATKGKISTDIRTDSSSTLNRSLCRGNSRQRRSLWATHKSPFNSSALYSHPSTSLPTYPPHTREIILWSSRNRGPNDTEPQSRTLWLQDDGQENRQPCLSPYCQVSNDWDFPQFQTACCQRWIYVTKFIWDPKGISNEHFKKNVNFHFRHFIQTALT